MAKQEREMSLVVSSSQTFSDYKVAVCSPHTGEFTQKTTSMAAPTTGKVLIGTHTRESNHKTQNHKTSKLH